MAKNTFALNFASLNVTTDAASQRKPITSDKVNRPLRDIVAQIHEQVRHAAWQSAIQTVAQMYGTAVDAKGASWIVNDDEAARALRVNYNLIQPDYFPAKVARKMTKDQSRELWTQVVRMLKDDPEFNPTFKDDSDDGDAE